MRRVLPLILAACSSGSAPDAGVAARPRPPLHAAHGAGIDLVAVTEDGGAALTQDVAGGSRLWPALDGSVEPVVVHLPAASDAVIARDGDGFSVSLRDVAGGLAVVRLTASGDVRSHVQLAADPVIERIASTGGRVIALRADQSIIVLDLAGVELARLVPSPGTRIDNIATRGGRAIAIEHARETQARWIELVGPIRWGGETPALARQGDDVALAPDGKQLAVARGRDVRIVDLATGSVASQELCPSNNLSIEALGLVDPPIELLGFIDDQSIACIVSSEIQRWSVNGTTGEPIKDVTTAALGGGMIVEPVGRQLALRRGKATQYLGYGLVAVEHLRVAPAGIAIGKSGQLLLDGSLHARRRFTLPDQLDDIVPLDDRYVLILRRGPRDSRRLSLYDTTAHADRQMFDSTAREIRYQAASHLLVISNDKLTSLVRLDPDTMIFGAPSAIGDGDADVRLLDPALARGAAAVVFESPAQRTMREIANDEVIAGAAVAPRASNVVANPVVAVDLAGRVYAAHEDVVDVRDSRLPGVVTFAHVGSAHVRPSPDGTAVAAYEPGRIRMFGADGTLRWETAVRHGVEGVDWLGGEPLVSFVGGLAKLDLATGQLATRACGWGFGLSGAPLEETTQDVTMACDED